MYISLRYKFEPTAAAAGIFAIALVVVSMVLSSRLVNLRRLVASTRLALVGIGSASGGMNDHRRKCDSGLGDMIMDKK